MKKIKLFATLIICMLISIMNFATFANAEELESVISEETAVESEIIPESEETPYESETAVENENKVFTDEEYKEYLDNVLTGTQKDIIDKVTTIVSQYTKISPTVIYCIVGSIFLVCIVIFVLVGKNAVKGSEISKLKEQNSAVIEMAKKSETELAKMIEVISNLSSEGFEKMLAERNGEIEKTLIESLKLDTATISELLTNGTKILAYLEKFFDFFKIMAIKKGDGALISTLSDVPDVDIIKKQELIIVKLTSALGEEAVKKILEQ